MDSSPLISIDLIIENPEGQFLLGIRNNRPAKNTWFVPGGRVQKSETLDDAFARLCKVELDVDRERKNSLFMGVYEHFYKDSVFGDQIATHYIVLAHKIKISHPLVGLPKSQHNAYKWMSENQIMNSQSVHTHTKWYFGKG